MNFKTVIFYIFNKKTDEKTSFIEEIPLLLKCPKWLLTKAFFSDVYLRLKG